MDIRNRRALKETAANALASNAGNPPLTALVYAGGVAVITLGTAVLNYIMEGQIANTGGLSNLGQRSVLATIQYILPIVQMLVLMCLQMGYTAATLRMARRMAVTPRGLTEGFGYFGPLLRTAFFRGGIYFLILIASLYAASTIFMLLPLSNSFYDVMEPLLADPNAILDEATMALATRAILPMLPIFLVVLAVLGLPVIYQYRMVNFCLLDSERPGALAAMRDSSRMMRRHRLELFRLDLSFWWFYLLEALTAVVCYGEVLLPMLGITLPFGDTAGYFLFYILSLVMQVVIYYVWLNRVQVTYAAAYEALRTRQQES